MDISNTEGIIACDPEIMGGMPVFAGTRVPIQALIDYLKGGETLDEFLRDFPSVTREQTAGAIQLMGSSLVTGAARSS